MTSEQPTPAQPPEPAARPPRGLVLAVAAVLAALLAVVATVLLWPEKERAPLPPPPSPTTATPSPTPTATPTPTPTPSRVVPYTFFPVGTCFDHPQQTRTVTKPEARPCEGEHDGEVVADLLLPDGLTETQLNKAVRDGCKESLAAAEARQGGGTFYTLPIGPPMAQYQQGWRDYTCSLTSGTRPGTPKLTGHLK
ncbi:hypothetical protein [Kitasatospora sp. A2-31]|uniref:hypothetical protein n=1 Tax=Kitasatospora sp. A2-31 TaxID=2916414 RepID=UPI001EE823F0|nr:hypothetical protein [Kitasatospora sp. A2-31]MCG6493113.1 hypothetical protein [Kitasatospora sp. A2-31]